MVKARFRCNFCGATGVFDSTTPKENEARVRQHFKKRHPREYSALMAAAKRRPK